MSPEPQVLVGIYSCFLPRLNEGSSDQLFLFPNPIPNPKIMSRTSRLNLKGYVVSPELQVLVRISYFLATRLNEGSSDQLFFGSQPHNNLRLYDVVVEIIAFREAAD